MTSREGIPAGLLDSDGFDRRSRRSRRPDDRRPCNSQFLLVAIGTDREVAAAAQERGQAGWSERVVHGLKESGRRDRRAVDLEVCANFEALHATGQLPCVFRGNDFSHRK